MGIVIADKTIDELRKIFENFGYIGTRNAIAKTAERLNVLIEESWTKFIEDTISSNRLFLYGGEKVFNEIRNKYETMFEDKTCNYFSPGKELKEKYIEELIKEYNVNMKRIEK